MGAISSGVYHTNHRPIEEPICKFGYEARDPVELRTPAQRIYG